MVYAIPAGTIPISLTSSFADDIVLACPEPLLAEGEFVPMTSWIKPAISKGTARSATPPFSKSPSTPPALPTSHPTYPSPSGQAARQDFDHLPRRPGRFTHGYSSAGPTSRSERESPPPTFMPSPSWDTPAHRPAASSLLMSPLIFDQPVPVHTLSPPVLHQTPPLARPTDVVSPPGMASPDFGGPDRVYEEYL